MKRLILAGAGHAHLHVLRTLGEAPWPGVEVVLVTPYPRQIYSGMVPGWIAGHYRLDAPHAKSGVYAVRAGPVLTGNLQRALAGQAIEAYRPQRRSLYLLATGPQEAIVSWGPLSAAGRFAWRWKDWIDRRFMRRYQCPGEA